MQRFTFVLVLLTSCATTQHHGSVDRSHIGVFSDTRSEAVVRRAIESWNRICGTHLEWMPSNPQIMVIQPDKWEDEDDALAITLIAHWSDGYKSSLIKVNNTVNWTRYDIESVVIHEMGHALGLDHTERGIMVPKLGVNERLQFTRADCHQ